MTTIRAAFYLSIVGSTLAPIGRNASAQEPLPSPPSATASGERRSSEDGQDLARLEGTLKHFASQSRGYRTLAGVSALTAGAASISSGAVMRSDGYASPSYFVISLGIGEVIAGGLLLAAPLGPMADFQRLSDKLDEERASGKEPDEIVANVESEWREIAESSRSLRRVVGILGLGVAAAAVTGGTYLAVADVSSPTFSKNEQYGLSAALFVLGYAYAILGSMVFSFEEPIEAAWSAYSFGKSRPPVSQLRLTGIGFAPAAGGGVVGLSGSF